LNNLIFLIKFINMVQFTHLRMTKNRYKYVKNNTATNLIGSNYYQ